MDIANQAQQDAKRTLAEDLGEGDLSAPLIPPQPVTAHLFCREEAVLCGVAWFEACFLQLAPTVFHWHAHEGDRLTDSTAVVCTLTGTVPALLSAERSALNLLQTLSATATAAAHLQQLAGSKAMVVDTRKTLPMLRIAQKYAVRIGGAVNHRLGLFDEILIKENHIRSGGGIRQILANAYQHANKQRIQIEVNSIAQMHTAIEAGATRILLDNFSLPCLRQAVREAASDVELEASGNISAHNIAAVAATGVHRISVGAMTKHSRAVDFSLLVASC